MALFAAQTATIGAIDDQNRYQTDSAITPNGELTPMIAGLGTPGETQISCPEALEQAKALLATLTNEASKFQILDLALNNGVASPSGPSSNEIAQARATSQDREIQGQSVETVLEHFYNLANRLKNELSHRNVPTSTVATQTESPLTVEVLLEVMKNYYKTSYTDRAGQVKSNCPDSPRSSMADTTDSQYQASELGSNSELDSNSEKDYILDTSSVSSIETDSHKTHCGCTSCGSLHRIAKQVYPQTYANWLQSKNKTASTLAHWLTDETNEEAIAMLKQPKHRSKDTEQLLRDLVN